MKSILSLARNFCDKFKKPLLDTGIDSLKTS